jgi:hypothetical protein
VAIILTNQDLELMLLDMRRKWPDLPNPNQEPIRFRYYVLLYFYDLKRN